MSEEKFNYEEFAQSMYEQSFALMPGDIGVGDKEYLATTIKQFSLMAGVALNNEYSYMDKNDMMICVQSVAEQTFKKGIEIITKGIAKEHRDGLLQKVAFTVYQIIQNAITNDIFNREYLEDIEKEVNNNLYKNVIKLLCNGLIDETLAKTFVNNDEEFYCLKNDVEEEIRQEESLDFGYDDSENDKSFNVRYEELTKYILENPNDPEGYFNRGYLQSCYNVDNNIVLSDYDKAIELNPNYIRAIKYRMYLYEHMGDYENVIKDCLKLIELEPTWGNYDLYIRYLKDGMNDFEKALECCNKTFELFEPNKNMYESRGGVHYKLKNYDNAIEDYKKALEILIKDATPEAMRMNEFIIDNYRITIKEIEQAKVENI